MRLIDSSPGLKQRARGSAKEEIQVSPFPDQLSLPCLPFRDDSGATAVEWAVLASGIAAVAVFAITGLGKTVAGLYQQAFDLIGAML